MPTKYLVYLYGDLKCCKILHCLAENQTSIEYSNFLVPTYYYVSIHEFPMQ